MEVELENAINNAVEALSCSIDFFVKYIVNKATRHMVENSKGEQTVFQVVLV